MEKGWSDDLLTGMRVIDAQHREIFKRAGRLFARPAGETPPEAYRETLDFLSGYAVFHFATEEDLMDKHAFPAAGYHKSRHGWFRREIERVGEGLVRSGYSEAGELRFNYLLYDWLRNHILTVDRRLTAFLRDRARDAARR
jgi:hemerythrin